MKPYKISLAVHWLRKFREKEQGLISYVNPPFYNEQHCRDIIEHSMDEEIRALGLNPGEARNLAKPPPSEAERIELLEFFAPKEEEDDPRRSPVRRPTDGRRADRNKPGPD